jgi:hypothetical protein
MDLHQIQQEEDQHRAALRRLAVARWEEMRRLHMDEGLSLAAIGRMYRNVKKQYILQLLRAKPRIK